MPKDKILVVGLQFEPAEIADFLCFLVYKDIRPYASSCIFARQSIP